MSARLFDFHATQHAQSMASPHFFLSFDCEVTNRPADIDHALVGAGPGTKVIIDLKYGISAPAAYARLTSRNRQSGGVDQLVAPPRGENGALKNLLIYSRMSLVRVKRSYNECQERGARHRKTLKAVTRKRPAVTCDRVPHSEADGVEGERRRGNGP